MRNKKIIELLNYRIDKAKEDLETAIELIELRKFSQSVNRSYYAIFHAVRALLALDEIDFKKHSGVIAYFQQNYVKTQILDKELSNIIVAASAIRTKSDYNDFFIVSKDEASCQVEDAEKFIQNIEKYLKKVTER